MLLRYTLQNLLRHPWRTLATILGVALGIAAVLGTVTVGDNINANLRDVFTRASGQAELLLAPSSTARAVIDAQVAEKLARAQPEVVSTIATLESYAVVRQDAGKYVRPLIPGLQGGFLLSGQPTERPDALSTKLSSGTFPAAGSSGIALTQAYAARVGLEIGDTLEFVAPIGSFQFRVTGTLKTDSGLSSLNGGQVGIVNLMDLQKATFLTGRISYLGLVLRPNADAEGVRTRLEGVVPPNLNALYPAGRGQVSSGLIQTVGSGLQVLAATLLALSGFLAYNTFAAATVERRREFALLRTLGFTQRQVLGLGYLEAAFVSVAGIIAGILLGIGIAAAITAFNAFLLDFPFRTLLLPWEKIAFSALIGTVTAFVAASGPARAASRVSPVQAAREAFVPNNGRSSLYGAALLILGLLLAILGWPREIALLMASLAMGLVFLGVALVAPLLLEPLGKAIGPVLKKLLGTPAKVGLSAALRSKGRNGVAVGAVALGMGLIVGVGGMVSGINANLKNWVDSTILGDMFVAAAAPFPDNWESTLKSEFPELREISPVAVRVGRFQPPAPGSKARNASLIFTNPERYDPKTGTGVLQFLEGNIKDSLPAFYEGGGVFVSGTISDRYGVHVGDTFTLRTDDGWTPFRVLGVVVDYTSAGESVVANLKDLERFGGGKAELYVLSVRAGLDPRAFGERLKNRFSSLFLDLQYNADYKALILKVTGQFFGSTNSLLVLTVLVAAMGVGNTLSMNLRERSHEMAVLRSLGFTRLELMRSVFAEGILVVMLGILLGLLGGVALSQTITAAANSLTGYRVAPTFPLELMILALVSSPLVGVLAAFVPARKAAWAAPAESLRQSA